MQPRVSTADPLLRLVVQAQGGEAGAWQPIVAQCGPRVYGLCNRLSADPDDCYQEIWEKVFRRIGQFDPEGPASFQTWVRVVAHHHLIDRHRRQRARGDVIPLSPTLTDNHNPERATGARMQQQHLDTALRRLPPDQARVVVMHHIEGTPLAEIAEIEGVAIGTLKSRLHRGRARLAREMSHG